MKYQEQWFGVAFWIVPPVVLLTLGIPLWEERLGKVGVVFGIGWFFFFLTYIVGSLPNSIQAMDESAEVETEHIHIIHAIQTGTLPASAEVEFLKRVEHTPGFEANSGYRRFKKGQKISVRCVGTQKGGKTVAEGEGVRHVR